jgi:hypothetical protein
MISLVYLRWDKKVTDYFLAPGWPTNVLLNGKSKECEWRQALTSAHVSGRTPENPARRVPVRLARMNGQATALCLRRVTDVAY